MPAMQRLIPLLAIAVAAIVIGGCGGTSEDGEASSGGGDTRLSLVAYSTPKEAYEELIPAFQATAEARA